MKKRDLTITKKGKKYLLKTCPLCGDEWYAEPERIRCALCGGHLVTRTPKNMNLEWDEIAPERTRRAIRKFARKLRLLGVKV